MDRRQQGCLQGLLELFLLDQVFNWMERQFGFGRGCSGCGCGVLMLIIFIVLACSIIFSTNWGSPFGG